MNWPLKIASITDRIRVARSYFPSDVTIIGSYNTLNAGDRILCDSVATVLRSSGLKVHIRSKRTLKGIKSKTLIVCGGDILHDATHNGWQFLQDIAKHPSKVYFVGAGVPGFFIHSKEEVAQLLNAFQLITLRDNESYQRLQSYKLPRVVQSVDNAFLWPQRLRANTSVAPQTIALNIMAFGSSSNRNDWIKKKNPKRSPISLEVYIGFWKSVIKHFKNNGYCVKNVPMTYQDALFVKKHFSTLLDHQYPFTLAYDKITTYISSAELVFSSRYHFLILSLLNGKKGYCYAYADKIEHLLNDLGIPQYIKREEVARGFQFTNRVPMHLKKEMYQQQINDWTESHWMLHNTAIFER